MERESRSGKGLKIVAGVRSKMNNWTPSASVECDQAARSRVHPNHSGATGKACLRASLRVLDRARRGDPDWQGEDAVDVGRREKEPESATRRL